MTITVANMLNTSLVFLEYTMLYILINGLFESKRPLVIEILSFIIAAAVNNVVIYFSQDNVWIKICTLAATMIIWMFFSFRVGFVKCLFPVLFWLAYLTICDNSMISLLGSIIGGRITLVLTDPDVLPRLAEHKNR